MEGVALGMLPVNIDQREALQVAADALGHRLAQDQHVVDLLVRAGQPIERLRLECLDRRLDVALAERMFLPLEADYVQLPQLPLQHPIQDHVAQPPPTQFQRLHRRHILPAQVRQY